jgi:hypothetical protein
MMWEDRSSADFAAEWDLGATCGKMGGKLGIALPKICVGLDLPPRDTWRLDLAGGMPRAYSCR